MANVKRKCVRAEPIDAIMRFDDYARYKKVSVTTVYDWQKAGYLKLVSRGRINVAESDVMVDARPQNAPGSKMFAAPAAPTKVTQIEGRAPYSAAEASRVKENYAALARQLEFERQAGSVIEVAKIASVVAGKLANVRSKMLGLGSEVAPRGIMCKTPDQLKALIDASVTRALEELTFSTADVK
jgi:hypothetical protein